jgi:hypothetical protein
MSFGQASVTDSTRSSAANQPWHARRDWRLVEYVGPLILLGIGLFLGLYDLLRGIEATGSLQVPALLAAMILSADAISRLDAIRSAGRAAPVVEEAPPAPAPVADPGRPGKAYYRIPAAGSPTVKTPTAEFAAPAAPPTRAPALAYGVLALAVWLAIASLISTTATTTLQLTSFLAAVLLFYRGWTVVVPRRS